MNDRPRWRGGMGTDWTCSHCGDVIGVYERAIIVEADGERLVSRLSEPSLTDERAARYHEACWLQAQAEPS